jgi:hypothetical protein
MPGILSFYYVLCIISVDILADNGTYKLMEKKLAYIGFIRLILVLFIVGTLYILCSKCVPQKTSDERPLFLNDIVTTFIIEEGGDALYHCVYENRHSRDNKLNVHLYLDKSTFDILEIEVRKIEKVQINSPEYLKLINNPHFFITTKQGCTNYSL